jgi:hypothetical protein
MRGARLSLALKRFLVSLRARQIARSGVLGVEIRSTVGLGARLEWCLEIMAYCDERGIEPRFRFSYPDARPPRDHFEPLFRVRGTEGRRARFVRISSIVELDLGRDYDRELTIDRASGLIRKYLQVKEDVVAEVDEFRRRHFGGGPIIGVHYR